MQHGLIDEFYVNVNPVVLGKGIPLFKDIERRFDLELVEAKTFSCGVQGLYYRKLGA
jgi:dihydrofolate reductase